MPLEGEYMAPRRSRLQRAIWTVGTTCKGNSKKHGSSRDAKHAGFAAYRGAQRQVLAAGVKYPPLRRPSRLFASLRPLRGADTALTAVLATGMDQQEKHVLFLFSTEPLFDGHTRPAMPT